MVTNHVAQRGSGKYLTGEKFGACKQKYGCPVKPFLCAKKVLPDSHTFH